ncbi:unnamed protein product [Protopolystoma xenopodis]|uniref:Uncharacterized protein n=1 Tax=Protopolystoma xenopodis TaxID=117903 RepID=A0A3S5A236_9PLAT|nr:unnamed protein product [Protopolystoma xenopodis]
MPISSIWLPITIVPVNDQRPRLLRPTNSFGSYQSSPAIPASANSSASSVSIPSDCLHVFAGFYSFISPSHLLVQDEDTPSEELLYRLVAEPLFGQLCLLVGPPGPFDLACTPCFRGCTFRQADIIAARVVYLSQPEQGEQGPRNTEANLKSSRPSPASTSHSSSMFNDSFTVTLTERDRSTSIQAELQIHVTAFRLAVATRPARLRQGDTRAFLRLTHLHIDLPPSPCSSMDRFPIQKERLLNHLEFTLTRAASYGRLYLDTVPIERFTFNHLKSNRLSYEQMDFSVGNDSLLLYAEFRRLEVFALMDKVSPFDGRAKESLLPLYQWRSDPFLINIQVIPRIVIHPIDVMPGGRVIITQAILDTSELIQLLKSKADFHNEAFQLPEFRINNATRLRLGRFIVSRPKSDQDYSWTDFNHRVDDEIITFNQEDIALNHLIFEAFTMPNLTIVFNSQSVFEQEAVPFSLHAGSQVQPAEGKMLIRVFTHLEGLPLPPSLSSLEDFDLSSESPQNESDLLFHLSSKFSEHIFPLNETNNFSLKTQDGIADKRRSFLIISGAGIGLILLLIVSLIVLIHLIIRRYNLHSASLPQANDSKLESGTMVSKVFLKSYVSRQQTAASGSRELPKSQTSDILGCQIERSLSVSLSSIIETSGKQVNSSIIGRSSPLLQLAMPGSSNSLRFNSNCSRSGLSVCFVETGRTTLTSPARESLTNPKSIKLTEQCTCDFSRALSQSEDNEATTIVGQLLPLSKTTSSFVPSSLTEDELNYPRLIAFHPPNSRVNSTNCTTTAETPWATRLESNCDIHFDGYNTPRVSMPVTDVSIEGQNCLAGFLLQDRQNETWANGVRPIRLMQTVQKLNQQPNVSYFPLSSVPFSTISIESSQSGPNVGTPNHGLHSVLLSVSPQACANCNHLSHQKIEPGLSKKIVIQPRIELPKTNLELSTINDAHGSFFSDSGISMDCAQNVFNRESPVTLLGASKLSSNNLIQTQSEITGAFLQSTSNTVPQTVHSDPLLCDSHQNVIHSTVSDVVSSQFDGGSNSARLLSSSVLQPIVHHILPNISSVDIPITYKSTLTPDVTDDSKPNK